MQRVHHFVTTPDPIEEINLGDAEWLARFCAGGSIEEAVERHATATLARHGWRTVAPRAAA